ncbi:MAG: type II toxin-antitoxin system RelE/ParE family toxin [Deltaproteobacteria bacterium]|nr:type II toxin-antitoxin system RelE/ParE family toxin [Deltaproteobacteria bacterium]
MPAGRASDEPGPRETAGLKLDYHPEASEELIEAARFYEGKGTGLGEKFLDAVQASLAMLQRNPTLGWADESGRRRWLVRRFPYLIVSRLADANLYILAVAHTSRMPRYWTSRDSKGD